MDERQRDPRNSAAVRSGGEQAKVSTEAEQASKQTQKALRALVEYGDLRRSVLEELDFSLTTSPIAVDCLAPTLQHLNDAIVDFSMGRNATAIQSVAMSFIGHQILAEKFNASDEPQPPEESYFSLRRCLTELSRAYRHLVQGDVGAATQDLILAASCVVDMEIDLQKDIAVARRAKGKRDCEQA